MKIRALLATFLYEIMGLIMRYYRFDFRIG